MHGMMMDRPLRIADIITLAEKIHPNEEIISRTLQGDLHTTNYGEIAIRSRQMSKALLSLAKRLQIHGILILMDTPLIDFLYLVFQMLPLNYLQNVELIINGEQTIKLVQLL